MDKIDIALVRELSQEQPTLPARMGLRSSYRNMAEKLGVSPGTVRQRINKLFTSGIVTGSSVYVNPSLVGLKGGAYAVEVASTFHKHDVIERLKQIDGILIIHNFHSSLVGIFFVYADENNLQEKIDHFQAATGARHGMFSQVLFPPCPTTFTNSELDLINRLCRGSFKSYSELSRELRTPIRTLKRRLSRIKAARAVASLPTLNYRAIDGGVPTDLIVVFADAKTKDETEKKVLEIVGDFLFFAGPGEGFSVYNLVLPKMVIADELTHKIMAIGGVKIARPEFVDDHIDLTKDLGGYIQKRLKSLKSRRMM